MLRADYANYSNITTATTTTVKTGTGILVTIVINATTTGTITIYDNTAGSGTKIATIAAGAGIGSNFPYLAQFTTGLTIVTTQADNITVVFGG